MRLDDLINSLDIQFVLRIWHLFSALLLKVHCVTNPAEIEVMAMVFNLNKVHSFVMVYYFYLKKRMSL